MTAAPPATLPAGVRWRAALGRALRRVPDFAPPRRPAEAGRVFVLDGLRGWAALSVVGYHLWWETFGAVVPGYRNPLTAALLDGPLAVAVFFVLSGAALSAGYFAGRGPRSVVDSAVKRYPRLVIPILAASLLTTMLMAFDLCWNVPAARVVDRAEWLGAWLQTPSGLGRSVAFAFYGVFTAAPSERDLMPFLWSMRIELVGSMLTFAVLLACHRSRAGWILFGAVFVALLAAYLWRIQTCGHLACFLVGIALSSARSAGLIGRAHGSRPMTLATTGLIVVLLAVEGTLHGRGLHPWRVPAMAMLLVPAVLCNRYADAVLDTGLSRFLGRISFPLFLLQFPVLVSFTSWAIVHVGAERVAQASTPICLASLALCAILARLFEPVEAFATRVCALTVAIPRSRGVGTGSARSDRIV